jgi:hypothetical protein
MSPQERLLLESLEALRGLPVLAGVRDPAALANLSETERQAWLEFWQDVERLLGNPAQATLRPSPLTQG